MKSAKEEALIINEEKRQGTSVSIKKFSSKTKNIIKTLIPDSLQGKRGAGYDVADILPKISEVNKKQRVSYEKTKIVSIQSDKNIALSPLEPEGGTNEGYYF